MKKAYILTLNGNYNFGNRLQNYALNHFVSRKLKCKTLWVLDDRLYSLKINIKSLIGLVIKKYKLDKFILFTKNNIKPYYLSDAKKLNGNYFIVGSDQVWNPNFPEVDKNFFLSFSDKENNISYAASFGVNEIPKGRIEEYKKGLNNIKYISVREDRGKELVKEITGRDDAVVLVDPTMLLTIEEWDKVSKKPKMLKNDKYILNYFLGELSKERKDEIERIAKENDCEIINLLDKNSPFYVCGPSEFLYLEKHAFLICTDSFHSSVFAILYNRPFVIFDREDNNENMGSRLDTLINKFKLKNRRYNGKNITKDNLEHDYSEAYKILEKERKKSDEFLRKALDIKDSE